MFNYHGINTFLFLLFRGGLSDHLLVEARLKLLGGWRSAGRMEGVRNVLKVSELNNSVN